MAAGIRASFSLFQACTVQYKPIVECMNTNFKTISSTRHTHTHNNRYASIFDATIAFFSRNGHIATNQTRKDGEKKLCVGSETFPMESIFDGIILSHLMRPTEK